MDRQEIKFLLNYLENNLKHLNTLQHNFFASLKANYRATGVMTKRQVEGLHEIKEYIRSLNMRESVYESESDKYQSLYSSFDSLVQYNM
jgi:hypothetical protein